MAKIEDRSLSLQSSEQERLVNFQIPEEVGFTRH